MSRAKRTIERPPAAAAGSASLIPHEREGRCFRVDGKRSRKARVDHRIKPPGQPRGARGYPVSTVWACPLIFPKEVNLSNSFRNNFLARAGTAKSHFASLALPCSKNHVAGEESGMTHDPTLSRRQSHNAQFPPTPLCPPQIILHLLVEPAFRRGIEGNRQANG